jgi:hypothetical protein
MKMNISVSPQVTLQKRDDGALLLDRKGQAHYELDDVGMRLWQLLTQNGDFEVAVAQMLIEFEVEEAVLRRDLLELLEDMAQADLVAWE